MMEKVLFWSNMGTIITKNDIMIITKTPYRISFFGGGSDYPSWYKKNGGAVLSTTK